MSGTRARWLPLAAGAIVGAIALAAVTAVPLGVFWDDGVYLISAKSLATGAGYRFLHLPGAPAAVHFPPAWPALLSLVWRLSPQFPDNVVLFKLINPILLAVGAALTCAYGVRRFGTPPWVAVAAAIIFGAALPVMVIGGVMFSEPLFFVVLMLALVLADRAVEAGPATPGAWRAALFAGAAAGALALVRSAGIVLVPALLIALLIAKKRRETVIAAAGAAVVLAPWQIWLASHVHQLATPLRGSYGPYLDWVFGLYRQRGATFGLTIARMNVLGVMRSLGITLFPFGPREIRPLLVTLVLVVTAVGVIRMRRRATTAFLFLLFYFGIVFVWPYAPDRFLWAVWPLLGMIVACGAVECWRLGAAGHAVRSVRATMAFACAIAVFAIGGHASYSLRGASRHAWDGAARTNADALIPVADWINANTKPDDLVASDGEPFVYLHTGRTMIPVHILSPDEYFAGTPLEQSAADLRQLIRTGHPRFAVFSAISGDRDAAPLLDGANGSPKLEWIAALPGGGSAYRVIESP